MTVIAKHRVVCGKKLQIKLDRNRNILSGGHYFGKMKVPTEDAKVVKRWKDKKNTRSSSTGNVMNVIPRIAKKILVSTP